MMEKHGRGKRRTFSAEYKAEAVRLVDDSGKSIGVIARELGLGETALRRWVQQAEIDAGRGPSGALTTGEREELGQLRRENQRLRMEREILKKATAGSMGRCNTFNRTALNGGVHRWVEGADQVYQTRRKPSFGSAGSADSRSVKLVEH
jgi:transposase